MPALAHDGRNPSSCECRAAPKNEPTKDDVKDCKASSPLIRWSGNPLHRHPPCAKTDQTCSESAHQMKSELDWASVVHQF
jgi:hypothetical protein